MNATINAAPNSTFILLKNACLYQKIGNLGLGLGVWQIKLQNFQTFNNYFLFFIIKFELISLRIPIGLLKIV